MLYKSIVCSPSSILTLLFFITYFASTNALINQNVSTFIDVSSQLVVVFNKVMVENKFSDPIESYLFIVDPQWMHNLSYIEAEDEKGNDLKVVRVYTDNSWLKYEIIFYSPLSPGENKTIQITSVIIDYLESYPGTVKQNDKHTVLFSFNVHYFSAYFTNSETTYVNLGSEAVMLVDGSPYKLSLLMGLPLLEYGPFTKLEPMSENISIIHYENYSPFLTVMKLTRFVKISFWDYLDVNDHVVLVHTGPKLEGLFNENTPLETMIASFNTTLPKDAFDVYLKDEIGPLPNFTVVYTNPKEVQVHIKPRSVLYGGRTTEYEIGYSLPINNYVTRIYSSDHVLKIPIVDRIFTNMVIKEAEIHVILPEGATFQDIEPYYQLENNTDNKYCYLMGYICKEVVTFRRYNLVDLHVTNMTLNYDFDSLLPSYRPLLIIIILLATILISLTFNILKRKPLTKETPVENHDFSHTESEQSESDLPDKHKME